MRSVAIEEDDRDCRRGHQVLDVAVGVAEFVHLALQLLVHRGELFVDRLQFLAARSPAPRSRCAAPHSSPGALRCSPSVPRCSPRTAPRCRAAAPSPARVRARADAPPAPLRRARLSASAPSAGSRGENTTSKKSGRDFLRRRDADVDEPGLALQLHRHAEDFDGRARLRRAEERRAQLHPQHRDARPCSRFMRRLAADDPQEAARRFRDMHDLVIAIHDERRRREALDQPEMQLFPRDARRSPLNSSSRFTPCRCSRRRPARA